jgi:hypothetical protein
MSVDEEKYPDLDFHFRLLSMSDEERTEFIRTAQRRYLADETIQSKKRQICAESSRVLEDCGFPQLKVVLEVDEHYEQSFVIVFRDEVKRQHAFSLYNHDSLRAGLEGMCFYKKHQQLCEQSVSQPLPEPSVPDVEARWLEGVSLQEKEEVAFLLKHTNSWLAQFGFPRLAGVLRLNTNGNPNIAIMPRDASGQLTSPPTFDLTLEGFSPHHISEFVLGMRFARQILSE